MLACKAKDGTGWPAKQKPASFEATRSAAGTSYARSADGLLPKLAGSVNGNHV